jgi:hypothetical protein
LYRSKRQSKERGAAWRKPWSQSEKHIISEIRRRERVLEIIMAMR